MMRTSVSFRPSSATPPCGGFTLLELLIVLALMSIAAAMVAPRLAHTYDAISTSGERAEVERQLSRLPAIARRDAVELDVAPGDGAALARLLELPSGWSVAPVERIHVAASGICNGAVIRVRGAGGNETWRLEAPACEVRDGVR